MSRTVDRVLDETSDISFAITTDSGELETQGLLLARSLRDVYPDAPLLVFIPESSVEDMDNDSLQYFRSVGHVILGEIPIPDYPISALIQAFIEAEQAFDTEYFVALDTDTLVFDSLRISGEGDIWLRPADVGAQYWCSEESRDDWKTLYQRFGHELPDRTENFSASIDRKSIPPYWNSGVVITTDSTLPSRWLEYTKALFYENELPVSTEEFFIDQISLALAVRDNEVVHLGEIENFPLGGRLLVPPDVAVVHYGDRRNLARLVQPHVRAELKNVGAIPSVDFSDLIHSLLTVVSTKSGLILSYRQKNTARELARRILPNTVVA